MKTDYRLEAPELVRDFLQYHETILNHSVRTVDSYYIDLRLFLRYIKWNHELVPADTPFEEISIRDVDRAFLSAIKKADIYNFLSWLARDRKGKKQMGIVVSARARKLVAIRSFFNYLVLKRNLLEQNPAADIDAPRMRKSLPIYLTESNAVKLLDAVQGPYAERDFCMLLLLLSCGMRVSELAGLNLKDITSDTVRVLGKGNKERLVPLNNKAKDEIRIYTKTHRAAIPKAKGYEDVLFLNKKGKALSRVMVFNIIKELALKAGINKTVSPHTLRHSFASHLVNGGADIRAVQDMLGHESILTTEIYTHLDNTFLRDTIINFHPRAKNSRK